MNRVTQIIILRVVVFEF